MRRPSRDRNACGGQQLPRRDAKVASVSAHVVVRTLCTCSKQKTNDSDGPQAIPEHVVQPVHAGRCFAAVRSVGAAHHLQRLWRQRCAEPRPRARGATFHADGLALALARTRSAPPLNASLNVQVTRAALSSAPSWRRLCGDTRGSATNASAVACATGLGTRLVVWGRQTCRR